MHLLCIGRRHPSIHQEIPEFAPFRKRTMLVHVKHLALTLRGEHLAGMRGHG
jgi:hypothetical protein